MRFTMHLLPRINQVQVLVFIFQYYYVSITHCLAPHAAYLHFGRHVSIPWKIMLTWISRLILLTCKHLKILDFRVIVQFNQILWLFIRLHLHAVLIENFSQPMQKHFSNFFVRDMSIGYAMISPVYGDIRKFCNSSGNWTKTSCSIINTFIDGDIWVELRLLALLATKLAFIEVIAVMIF